MQQHDQAELAKLWEAIDRLPDLPDPAHNELAELMAAISKLPDIDPNRLTLARGPQVLEALAASLQQQRDHAIAVGEALEVLEQQNAYIGVLEQQLADQQSAMPEPPAASASALGAEFELTVHHDRAGQMTSMSAPSIRARFEFRRDGANRIRRIRAAPMA